MEISATSICLGFLFGILSTSCKGNPVSIQMAVPYGESNPHPRPADSPLPNALTTLKYKWVALGGAVHNTKVHNDMVEVAATSGVSEQSHSRGAAIVSRMVRYMSSNIFTTLARSASVGLFTAEEPTTVFTEYQHLADTPQCRGSCAGSCYITCTGDGRKYDSLAGLGGKRGTCLDDNFMCTYRDPYRGATNILVHEFAHTVHGYSLPQDLQYSIYYAWYYAWYYGTWDRSSYAMSNYNEYFAEAAGVFFNVNHHSSSGGMNSCGRAYGFCQTEYEARAWLKQKDPAVYNALVQVFTAGRASLTGDITKCP